MLSELREIETQLCRFVRDGWFFKGFIEPCPNISMGKEVHTQESHQIRKRPCDFELSWRYFRINMAMSAVQIWIFTALALVLTKVFILRFCLSALKNSSICQRSLYMATIVVAPNFMLLARNTRTSSFSGSYSSIHRRGWGHFSSAFVPVRGQRDINRIIKKGRWKNQTLSILIVKKSFL